MRTQIYRNYRVNGDVIMGNGNLIHPNVLLISHSVGRTNIGQNNVVEETSIIEDSVIGDNNVLEVGCSIKTVEYYHFPNTWFYDSLCM
jgi:NDP-sugar pyrophosphorylase family protein